MTNVHDKIHENLRTLSNMGKALNTVFRENTLYEKVWERERKAVAELYDEMPYETIVEDLKKLSNNTLNELHRELLGLQNFEYFGDEEFRKYYTEEEMEDAKINDKIIKFEDLVYAEICSR